MKQKNFRDYLRQIATKTQRHQVTQRKKRR